MCEVNCITLLHSERQLATNLPMHNCTIYKVDGLEQEFEQQENTISEEIIFNSFIRP